LTLKFQTIKIENVTLNKRLNHYTDNNLPKKTSKNYADVNTQPQEQNQLHFQPSNS